MPAGDGMAQFLMAGAQLAELLEPLDQLRPFVRDQRQQKAATAGRTQRPRRNQHLLDRQIVALKIDAGEAINLQIDERGSEPKIAFGRTLRILELSDDSLAPADADKLPRRVMSCPDFSIAHGAISVASSADCKRFAGRKIL